MSVIVEFTMSTADFVFGSALATVEDMRIELEAIVPTGENVVPYFWATGEDFDAFERHVVEDSGIDSLTQLDRVDDSALYRATWGTERHGILDGLAATEAVVLEAMTMREGWYFRVRFPTNDRLEEFHDAATDQNVLVHVDRVAPLAEASRAGRLFDLTAEQREALALAVEEGYFEVPRRTDLSAIGERLGISQQAASKRVRRAADTVLRASVLGPRERS